MIMEKGLIVCRLVSEELKENLKIRRLGHCDRGFPAVAYDYSGATQRVGR